MLPRCVRKPRFFVQNDVFLCKTDPFFTDSSAFGAEFEQNPPEPSSIEGMEMAETLEFFQNCKQMIRFWGRKSAKCRVLLRNAAVEGAVLGPQRRDAARTVRAWLMYCLETR